MRHGEYDEARARAAARRARVHEPLLRPRDAGGHEAVADVPARAAVRARASTRRPRSRCSPPPARAAAGGLPIYAILCLPILFAAGMSLLDTIDGAFMNFAYGWAFAKPVRKVYYNITITALSVAVALIIGTIELIVGLRRQAQPHRRRLGLRLRPRPQLRRLRDRRAVRRSRGWSRSPSGASGASRSAGRPGSSQGSRPAARSGSRRENRAATPEVGFPMPASSGHRACAYRSRFEPSKRHSMLEPASRATLRIG